jgi:hypothetical protein
VSLRPFGRTGSRLAREPTTRGRPTAVGNAEQNAGSEPALLGGIPLDREPDSLATLRSRGANLLPPSGRETMNAVLRPAFPTAGGLPSVVGSRRERITKKGENGH